MNKKYFRDYYINNKDKYQVYHYDICNCGNKKAKISKQCRKCHFSSRIGYKHSEDTKNKIGMGNKGKFVSILTGRRISKSKTGKKINAIGRKPSHGNWGKYKGIWMRSSWEVKFAKWCNKNHIKWQYEPKAFDLKITGYITDFYLPELDIYIEIKGWWRDDAKKKFRLFKRLYPDIKIIILTKTELENLRIL